ncbi:MAG: hypothetical protein LBK58_16260 [Prevotellaceae bacterium]|jgi:hypothetical protein|nr:hypothetical protein [Prevotellaceae bacterium]
MIEALFLIIIGSVICFFSKPDKNNDTEITGTVRFYTEDDDDENKDIEDK